MIKIQKGTSKKFLTKRVKSLLEGPYLDVKVLKFDNFGGVGNPIAHLRAFCDQLVGIGWDETLLMRLFNLSLCGEDLERLTSNETRWWSKWNALAKEFIDRFDYIVEIIPG